MRLQNTLNMVMIFWLRRQKGFTYNALSVNGDLTIDVWKLAWPYKIFLDGVANKKIDFNSIQK